MSHVILTSDYGEQPRCALGILPKNFTISVTKSMSISEFNPNEAYYFGTHSPEGLVSNRLYYCYRTSIMLDADLDNKFEVLQ